MITKNKIFKTAALVLATTTLAETSNAWFWDNANEREMRMTPEGQFVPARSEGWLARATTYHSELKPTYNPETQRVEKPTFTVYDGQHIETASATVKPAWYDKMTTYHEEDRRPWNPYETTTKDIPAYMYYDKKEARAYNEHYGQDGLKPVPYMYGSASLVLRKDKAAEEIASLETQNLDGIAKIGNDPLDARIVGMDNVYIRPAGGFEQVDERGAMNDMQAIRSNYIAMSDPVSEKQGIENYNNVMIGSPKQADVQAKTKIQDPNLSWRDKLDGKVSMARPGDFDYKNPEKTLAKPYKANQQDYNNYGGGEVIAGTDGFVASTQNYNNYAAEGKVNNYTVENGDTLSEISDKEKIYGDWTLWPLIYDANRNQVNDPDLIMPGQNLDIPRDYNSSEENDARYRAKNREMPITLYDGR